MTHPLDKAIKEAEEFLGYAETYFDFQKTEAHRLAAITLSVSNAHNDSTGTSLGFVAARSYHWLTALNIKDPWEAMRDEYDRAKLKHGDMTLDSDTPTDNQRFYALVEELGEIARALTYDKEHAGELAAEIRQLGALALAWLTHELEKETSRD